jgi:hypothetical protein
LAFFRVRGTSNTKSAGGMMYISELGKPGWSSKKNGVSDTELLFGGGDSRRERRKPGVPLSCESPAGEQLPGVASVRPTGDFQTAARTAPFGG